MNLDKVSVRFRVSAPDTALVEVGNGSNMVGNPHHVFELLLLKKLLLWISGLVGRTLYISGPTGCGKTSTLIQFAVALGYKVYTVGISQRSEFTDKLGYVQLVPLSDEYGVEEDNVKSSGFIRVMMKIVKAIRGLARSAVVTKFFHGELGAALVAGMSEKIIVLLDEIDSGRDNQAYFPFLEGREVRLPSGEVLNPKNIWIAATGNTVGGVDERGLHNGVVKQNVALGNRFAFHVLGGYMPAECEERAIELEVPKLAPSMRTMIVSFANQIRTLYDDGELEVPLSTRTLVWWAKMAVCINGTPDVSPLKEALVTTYVNQNQRDDRVKILELWQRVAGE